MSYYNVKSENGITHLKFTRPDKLNALNVESLQELKDHLKTIEQNDDAIVVLSGEGKGFCAGGDVSMMESLHGESSFHEVMSVIEEIIETIYLMPKLIISAVHGSAVGLGLSIALSSDYVLAHNQSKLSMNFIGIGLLPDGGGHFWLQERLGVHKAKQFAWHGKSLVALEAYEEGLVDEVTEDEAETAALSLAQAWQKRPLQAMIATKQVYHRNRIKELQSYMEQERNLQYKLRGTQDHKEGVQAFMQKREPHFVGK
ncbi:enoyl-CoA hydratase [Pontibacillus marinus]|uniref:Enoyl-CoA hydratase n=1 Tax=Pontibacillus marinus BH030004 = DSM 16465 TaxID=1385511 RepID=A0A0A5G293_9BACI|nr:enoyl-CoA hydratase [Pontibacillus marinus]KGX86154.1 enoyl-CoA hydratase [Pontibacillus marinus BH030004 = DSM 16465]